MKTRKKEIVLIGAGIMSATLAMLLNPDINYKDFNDEVYYDQTRQRTHEIYK